MTTVREMILGAPDPCWKITRVQFRCAISDPRDPRPPEVAGVMFSVSVYEKDGVTPSGYSITGHDNGVTVMVRGQRKKKRFIPDSNIAEIEETLEEEEEYE